MKVSVVIPFLNRWDLTHARLMEIYKYCPLSDIALVNDGSTDTDCDGGVAWWQNGALNGRLKYYKNKKNLGFGQSMNTGAAIAIKNGADVIILLSNDVSVRSDIGKEAIEIVEHNSQPVLIGAQILYSDTGWNVMDNVGVIPYANGWLLACHKEVWNTLGGFDKVFGRFDYEDVDLSTTAWYKGIKLVSFINAKVSHLSGQTVNSVAPNRIAYTQRNQILWKEKWFDKTSELKEKIYGQK